MEKNEFTGETTKAKVTPQFNVRIGEDLKQTIDTIASETGKSKVDLLDEFVRVYQTKRADDKFADLDLSRYDNLSNPLKESVYGTFNHILDAVNGNLSTLKQAGIQIEEEKRSLSEREESYKVEISSIKSTSDRKILELGAEKDEAARDMNSQIEFWKSKSSELEAKNTELHKEFDNVNKIADQVQIVTAENKDLRESSREVEAGHKAAEGELYDQIKALSRKLTEAEQSVFRVDLENESKDRTIEALKEQILIEKKERIDKLDELKKELLAATLELSDTQNKYNKALGKLEVLEALGAR